MITSIPVESRSRWAASISYAVPGVLSATVLTICMPDTGLNVIKPMSDGIQTTQSNAGNQGSIGTIAITVEGGHITATSYETTLADGTDKGAEYNKNSTGEVFNEDYYKKVQAATASCQKYSDNLTKVSDPVRVGVVTGAIVAYQQFVQVAIHAIAATQSVPPDGTDDTNIPSLNDVAEDDDLDKDLGGSDG